jgi:four helix bundle protein
MKEGIGVRGEGLVKSYQDLIVWQKSMEVVERVYRMTKVFPVEERYGLSNQIRRAAVSIPSNIAEGHSRQSNAEYRNFISIAQGSRAEVETQTLIAVRLGYVTGPQVETILSLLIELSKMLSTLQRKLDPHP